MRWSDAIEPPEKMPFMKSEIERIQKALLHGQLWLLEETVMKVDGYMTDRSQMRLKATVLNENNDDNPHHEETQKEIERLLERAAANEDLQKHVRHLLHGYKNLDESHAESFSSEEALKGRRLPNGIGLGWCLVTMDEAERDTTTSETRQTMGRIFGQDREVCGRVQRNDHASRTRRACGKRMLRRIPVLRRILLHMQAAGMKAVVCFEEEIIRRFDQQTGIFPVTPERLHTRETSTATTFKNLTTNLCLGSSSLNLFKQLC